MRQPDDPLPVIEMAPAGIATCDECGEDNVIPITVMSTGHWNVQTSFECSHCDQRNVIDLDAFAKLLRMNWQ